MAFGTTPDRTFTWKPTPLASLDLHGRRVLVVGGTDGLGRALARAAVARGAHVTVVGRTFRDEGVVGIDFVRADLSSLREAERLGATLPADVDVVVLTTGIFSAPQRQVTEEGIERDMAVSFLSRRAILRGLAPRLRDGTRVFVMGFPGTGQAGTHLDDLNADGWYAAFEVHMNTVAGNEALVLDGARRQPRLRWFGLNPGLVKSAIRSNFLGEGSLKHRITERLVGWLTPSAERVAERLVPLLFAPELDGASGRSFDRDAVAIRPSAGLTDARVEELLAASDALIARATAA